MPNSRLILHVKGTHGETTELPRHVVRAAISRGEITQSQLIWSAPDNAWKQVREMPELMTEDEQVILHVKGTQAETTQVPRRAVKAAITKGEITYSQLIWSAPDNSWKQVREMPDLLPSQKLAPPPIRVPTSPIPKIVDGIIPESPTSAVDRASAASVNPKVKVKAASAPPRVVPKVTSASVKPASRSAKSNQIHNARNLEVIEVEPGFNPMKWICIGLGVVVAAILGANYLLVHQPLTSKMGQSNYTTIPVYAHYGAFVQPNVLVIHIPASATLTHQNLTDFLVVLARSTPDNPLTHDLFDRVALTSGWTAQYSFSGYSWKQLGTMQHDTESQRRDFIMAQMNDASGQPMIPPTTLNEKAQQAMRDKAWAAFLNHFAENP